MVEIVKLPNDLLHKEATKALTIIFAHHINIIETPTDLHIEGSHEYKKQIFAALAGFLLASEHLTQIIKMYPSTNINVDVVLYWMNQN